MNHIDLMGDKKSFLLKITFFVVLLIFAFSMYLESQKLLDAAYLAVVMVLFIKFLLVKLYH